VIRWIAGIGIGAAAILAVALAAVAQRERTPADPAGDFLAKFWAQPILPQGAPAAIVSPLEASLSPDACGTCHQSQINDWSAALHSKAVGAGLLWQLRIFDQSNGNDCLRCHAPLAEQKALFALKYKWPNAPAEAVPDYVSPDLEMRGVSCAVCHLRGQQRFGPPPLADKPAGGANAAGLPHGGFKAEAAYEDSRFCAPCHQFPSTGKSVNGKPLENTYEEWKMSKARADGRSCQTCHMPERRHLWKGIHDKAMVTQGIRREVDVERLDARRVRVSGMIRTDGVGHAFPTYAVPKVYVSLVVAGQGRRRVLAQQIIGRNMSVDLSRETSDTRIPPNGEASLTTEGALEPGDREAILSIHIEPAEHYVRMFESMLRENPKFDDLTRKLLRQAISEAQATAYDLDDVRVPIPKEPGAPPARVEK
jgi:hypothetical protein